MWNESQFHNGLITTATERRIPLQKRTRSLVWLAPVVIALAMLAPQRAFAQG